jgi:hypothetical protein
MLPSRRLSEVFDRGLRRGLESLAEEERELYRIQDFIIEQEMNGLSGYFYNRLPNREQISLPVKAMQRYGLPDLAALLNEALQLFEGCALPDAASKWSDILRRYDTESRLNVLGKKINALGDY